MHLRHSQTRDDASWPASVGKHRTHRGEGLVDAVLVAAVFAAACLLALTHIESLFVSRPDAASPFSSVLFRFTGTLPSVGRWQDLLQGAPSEKSQGFPASRVSRSRLAEDEAP